MSEKKKTEAVASPESDASKPETPKAVRTVEELTLENEMLIEQLRVAEAKAKALELVANTVKLAESNGSKAPRAKLQLLGDGRRTVLPGMALTQSELVGLTEGVHFELV